MSYSLAKWSQIVRAVGYFATTKPTADGIMVLELCSSDANKPLLLASPDFIPNLVDALLLDPDHPRAGMTQELKTWCQEHHAECLAQLAVFEPAHEPLRHDPSVIPALEAVAAAGLSAEARKFADAALLALSDVPPPNIRGLDRGRYGLDKRSGLPYLTTFLFFLEHKVPEVKRFGFSMTDDISSTYQFDFYYFFPFYFVFLQPSNPPTPPYFFLFLKKKK